MRGVYLQDLDFTFHRAFDMVRRQREALEALVSCGVPRVLTSGSAQTALQVEFWTEHWVWLIVLIARHQIDPRWLA